jgi:LmbE family N-acetylglucosaminyl deacetylase
LRASVVLATSPRDHHADHQAAWILARAAVRASRVQLLPYRVWSRLDEMTSKGIRGGSKGWAILSFRSQISNYIDDDPSGFRFDAPTLKKMLAAPESVKLMYDRQIVTIDHSSGRHPVWL